MRHLDRTDELANIVCFIVRLVVQNEIKLYQLERSDVE